MWDSRFGNLHVLLLLLLYTFFNINLVSDSTCPQLLLMFSLHPIVVISQGQYLLISPKLLIWSITIFFWPRFVLLVFPGMLCCGVIRLFTTGSNVFGEDVNQICLLSEEVNNVEIRIQPLCVLYGQKVWDLKFSLKLSLICTESTQLYALRCIISCEMGLCDCLRIRCILCDILR